MFCKSGILIFIFAENNYSVYAHMLIKTPLFHQSFGILINMVWAYIPSYKVVILTKDKD